MIGPVTVICLAAILGQPEDSFEAFFAEFAAKRDEVRVLEARFTQKTVTSDETIISTGRILYAKPRRLIFLYDDPELAYIIDGLRGYEYDAELRQLQIFEIEDRPETEAFFLGFEDNAKRLEEAYHIRLLPPKAPGSGGKRIELKPKNPDSASAYFEQVTIELRPEDYLPTQIHIVNDEESSVLIDVSDYNVNPAFGPEKTQIFLPEGTDIIENDHHVEKVGPGGKRVPPPMAVSEGPLTRETPKEPVKDEATMEERTP